MNANVGESLYACASKEWGEQKVYVLEIIKALYGLKTSAQQWSLYLSNALHEIGFTPTRADSDL